MPVIPKLQTEDRIDTRVAQGYIEREGGGAVSRVVGGMGNAGASIATKFLQKLKESQASQYASDATREKRLASQQKWRELSLSMDKYGDVDGVSAYTLFEEWENESTETMADKAPTDLARESFLNLDRPATSSRLVSAEQARFKWIVDSNDAAEADWGQQSGKYMMGYDQDQPGNRKAYLEGNALLKEMEIDRDLKTGEGGLHNELSNRSSRLRDGNVIANGTAETLFTSGDIKGLTLAVGLDKMLEEPEFKEMALNHFEKLGLYKKGEKAELVTTADGNLAILKPFKAKGKEVSKLYLADGKSILTKADKNSPTGLVEIDETGKPIAYLTVLSPSRVVNREIVIDGVFEGEENLVEKYLTDKDKRDWGRTILRELSKKNAEKISDIRGKVRDASSALASTRPGYMSLSRTNDNDYVKGLLKEVDSYETLSDYQKMSLKADLAVSAILGTAMRGSKLTTSKQDEWTQNTMGKRVDELLKEWGVDNKDKLGEMVKEAAFSRYQQLRAAKAAALRESPADYVLQHDGEVQRKAKGALSSPEGTRVYAKAVRDRYTALDLPPSMQTQIFSPGQLANIATNVNNLFREKSYLKVADTLDKLRENAGEEFWSIVPELAKHGVPEEFHAAALMPSKELRALVIDNFGKRDAYLERMPPTEKEEIKSALVPLTAEFRRAFASKDVTGGGVEKENFLNGAFEDEAMRIYLTNPTTSVKNAAEMAYKRLSQGVLLTNAGKSIIAIPKPVADANGLSVNMIKAAQRKYASRDYLLGKVDLEKSMAFIFEANTENSSMSRTMDIMKKKGKKERNAMAYNILKKYGTFEVNVDNSYRYMVPLWRREDGVAFPLINSKGYGRHSVPLDVLKDDKDLDQGFVKSIWEGMMDRSEVAR